jgi:DNA-binding MarR family transcriptional regulator
MEMLKLEQQLCFPIYALSRQITALYRPLLDKLDLTYPQYLVMLLLWDKNKISIKEIGEKLLLDTGTLTPLLKRLEQKKYLTRKRSEEDERIVLIELTGSGQKLKYSAAGIPGALFCALDITENEMVSLQQKLTGILNTINKQNG